MKQGWLKKLLPHGIAVLIFLLIAVIYCRPVLQGNVLNQSDVTQWKGMAKNSFDYKETHGHFPLWSNSMFSGMPAYQIAMESGNVVSPGIFYYVLTLGLPKPISFFFLACVCFYFLTQAMRLNPYVGIIGSLAFAYATYNTGIIEAGHDTKMQTIAFMPAFIGSILLVYERRYAWGAALTALFTSLIIAQNHMQILYYSLIVAFFLTLGYLYRWIRQRNFGYLGKALGIVAVAGALGVLTNAVTILTTLEASKTTIRGGTELPDQNSTKTGLSKDYALSYSMYKSEPLVLMFPNVYGGSGGAVSEKLENSKAVEALQSMPPELANQIAGLPVYWGGIGPIPPNAPAYLGAVICFLALLGFFILDDKHKWWMLGAIVLSFLMAWGQYFEGFNTFLLNALPGYNKFRVPSMILVIPTLLLCMMAVMTVNKIILWDDRNALWERYKKGLLLTGGIFVLLLILYFTSDFTSQSDKQLSEQASAAPDQIKQYVNLFLNALKDDRKTLLFGSLMRSLFLIASAGVLLWAAVRGRVKSWILIAVLGILAFGDVISVDSKYLNQESYKEEAELNANYFTPSGADQQIMQDKSYYRVFDLRQGISGTFQYGLTSYFHNSLGGYHPAKLSIYQDLIEHQLQKFPASLAVVNMLNAKYIIQADQSGKESIYPNPDNLGAAWLVSSFRFENDAPAVMRALDNFHPRDTAVLFAADRSTAGTPGTASATDTIALVKNDNDEITYRYSAAQPRFAVFSEIYYPYGWTATVDGKELPIIRTNYVLRGVLLPAGTNKEIRFVFHPSSFYTGKTVSLIAGLIVLLLIAAAAFLSYKTRNDQRTELKL